MFAPNCRRMYRVLLINNHDSFVYNVYQLLNESGLCRVSLLDIDELKLQQALEFDKVVISPGPGLPSEMPGLIPLIRELAGRKPVLGICLGHQAIAEAFGARLLQLETIRHGYRDVVRLTSSDEPLFAGIGNEFQAGRYHSWVVDEHTAMQEFEITARNAEGLVMAIRHRQYKLTGLQFHPESYMTDCGNQLIRNWLKG
jgi:anthranilate synthase component 2